MLAAAIRAGIRGEGLTVPVVTAGGFNSFDQAEAALQATGHADIVAAARQSLADPDWFAKDGDGAGGGGAAL
jgi:2,4-dienoyl-CoA reductase-like NADH-dependent reductase (Old Yellow Enzyme family)